MGKLDDLFAMKWVLPEHAQALSHHYYKESLSSQPILEEDALAEMNFLIQQSIHEDYALAVTWFVPEVDARGHMETEWGWVKGNPSQGQIKLVRDEDFWWIDLKRLVSVERV
ncbi:YolD-like family protein [Brevibacillus centrosporus]|uniref:YolD-like family protein n=1 Tax=Brevibacillus centrosporus TaxID=54910 RepID=UPI002E1B3F18|nr:YolD-like family protein [Brevibacillus centrosporus]